MIHNAHIQIYAYYVLGLPWETKETIEETFEFASKLNTEYASFFTATALVGTKYYEYAKNKRLGTLNYEKPYIFPSVKCFELSAQEIYEYNRKFNKNYYLRPKYILKMLFSINSLAKLQAYYDAFLRLTKA